MQVQVWADVICPWCGLGDHRLRRALERFEHAADVEVIHRSFQLDPTAPEGVVRPVAEYLAGRGMNPAQVAAGNEQLERLAAEDGLSPYRPGSAAVGSTALVHEVLALAAERGVGDSAWQAAFRAHFGQNQDVFTVDGLVALAPDFGLDPDEVQAALDDRRYRPAVQADMEAAAALGISGVPFFILDGRAAVSGARSIDDMLAALRTVYAQEAR